MKQIKIIKATSKKATKSVGYIVTILTLCLLFTSCVSMYKPSFTYSIKGKEGAKLVKDNYEIDVSLMLSNINLVIHNKGKETLRLIVDESLFTAADGQTHRLVDGRTTVGNRSQSQPPVVIPKNSKVAISLVSADGMVSNVGYIANPLLTGVTNPQKDIGKEFILLLTFRDFNDKKFEEELRLVVTGDSKKNNK